MFSLNGMRGYLLFRNNILNAKLIRTISTSVHTMEPRTLSAVILSHDFTSDPPKYEPPNGPLSSANYNSTAKVAMEVLKEVRELFPWITLRTRDWGVKDMLSVGNHLGRMIVDISTGNIAVGDLHTCIPVSKLRLADGLAAHLMSYETFLRYNPGCRRDTITGRARTNTTTLLRKHKGTRELAGRIKVQFGLLQSTCSLRGNEEIVGTCGRVRVSMRIEDNSEGRRKLMELKSLPVDDHLGAALDEIGIWSVSFKYDEKENLIPTNGYSGYVALDQIIRSSSKPANVLTSGGSLNVIESSREFLSTRGDKIRHGWKEIHLSRRNPFELMKWMVEDLEVQRSNDSIPWIIPDDRGLQEEALKGSGPELGYSRWIRDQDGRMQILESQLHVGLTFSIPEWITIMSSPMMCSRAGRYYVRLDSLEEDMRRAGNVVIQKIRDLMIKGAILIWIAYPWRDCY